MKIDPTIIIKDHIRTLRDVRTDKASFFDILIFYIIPFGVSASLYFANSALDKEVYNVSVTFFGIFIALLLNIQVAIFGILQRRRDDPSDKKLRAIHDRALSDRMRLLSELNSNISYLVLVCCLALVVFLIFFSVPFRLPIAVSVTVFFYMHFLLTLVMVVKRAHALFQREYDDLPK